MMSYNADISCFFWTINYGYVQLLHHIAGRRLFFDFSPDSLSGFKKQQS